MKPLAPLRILVTNDDGIDAEGLAVLTKVAHNLSDDVWVVAPETQQSGASHSLTLHSALHITQKGDKRYAIDGTPTDCVVLAVKEIIKGKRPDLVLSGVNRGSNLGEDVTYSGTIAAAMEGTLLDIPSIAFSQTCTKGLPIPWEVPATFAGDLVIRLFQQGIPNNRLMNINFPECSAEQVRGIKVSPQGKRKIGDNIIRSVDPDNRPSYWIGTVRNEEKEHPATDLAAIRDHFIALTPLCLDLTDYDELGILDEQFTCQFATGKKKEQV